MFTKKKLSKNKIFITIFFIIFLVFFYNFFIRGFLPVPSDAIVGLYHPFRDLYVSTFPSGIPFKNFLITDPVRQIIPWKFIAIESIFKLKLPLWNPYEMTGTPLLANFQSGPFYILNLVFLLKPFYVSWGFFIFLQPLLAAIFTFYYVCNLGISRKAAFLGGLTFSFSGFFVAWLEWGNILHTALWLPLILLSVDKIIIVERENEKIPNAKYKILKTQRYGWPIVFVFSLVSAFFAGHLQTFFYLFILSLFYLIARLIQFRKSLKVCMLFIVCYLLFIILTAVQWLPTLQFILLSARNIDQVNRLNAGWFIPWQNLIQFLAPDFFGNPTTLNYWGVWNYGEMVGYVGVLPLIFASFAIFKRYDRKTIFFGTVFFLCLIFSLPTFFAKLPFILNIPFLSTAQPTRLLVLTDFSLAILTALGFEYFDKTKKGISEILLFFLAAILFIWAFIFYLNSRMNWISEENILIAKRNMILPTILFAISSFFICLFSRLKKNSRSALIFYLIFFLLTVLDLLRFAFKFTPFTNKNYFFPQTKIINFLENQQKPFRIVSADSRIFPPNLSSFYKIESIEGYDPLYLLNYGEFIAALERNKPNIDLPLGFNRIITPHNIDSKFIDILNVKYALSLNDLSSSKFKKVFQEGQTRVYENKNVYPRAFFVNNLLIGKSKIETLSAMFGNKLDKTAIINDANVLPKSNLSIGEIDFIKYENDKIQLSVRNNGDGFLVLTDSFYPGWHALIDGAQVRIYKTDYAFRGIFVPSGRHQVLFYMSLF